MFDLLAQIWLSLNIFFKIICFALIFSSDYCCVFITCVVNVCSVCVCYVAGIFVSGHIQTKLDFIYLEWLGDTEYAKRFFPQKKCVADTNVARIQNEIHEKHKHIPQIRVGNDITARAAKETADFTWFSFILTKIDSWNISCFT